MSEPKMLPIPAPEPATPTVAAPAPMNLAAESMSRDTAEVCRERTVLEETNDCSFCWASRALLTGRKYICDRGAKAARATGATILAQYILVLIFLGSCEREKNRLLVWQEKDASVSRRYGRQREELFASEPYAVAKRTQHILLLGVLP